jgi:N-acetylneuraminic acid mutarotase
VSPDGDVVIFGGDNAGALGSDTWIWHSDHGVWEARNGGLTRPPARAGAAGAVDASRNRLVVFGGVAKALGSEKLGDVWEYDVGKGTWTQGTSSGGPTARVYAASAYDSARQRVLFFGGLGSADSGETWAWDGAANHWQLLTSSGPSPRYGAAMAYDSVHDRFVLFGGTVSSASGVALADTWKFDPSSNTWSLVSSTSAPPGRTAHALAFDPESERVVLFGGTGSSSAGLADVWLFDGGSDDWSALQTEGNLSQRAGHALVFDPYRHALLAIGGLDYSSSGISTRQHIDLWTLKLAENPPRWTKVDQAIGPLKLRAAMAYDSARNRLVAMSDANLTDGKTWEIDTASGTWSPPIAGGSVQRDAPFVYDSVRSRVVAVGSVNGSQPGFAPYGGVNLYDWNGVSWTPGCSLQSGAITSAAQDSPAKNASIAFDSTRGRILIYGGQGTGWRTPAPVTTVWNPLSTVRVFDPVTCTASRVVPAVMPSARDFAASVYVPSDDRMYAFGGKSSTDGGKNYSPPRDDFWAYDLSTSLWTEFTGTRPSARADARIAFDAARNKIVLGPPRSGGGADTWEFDIAAHVWTQASASDPAVRGLGAFVYDTTLARVVNVDLSGRRFVWNGQKWTDAARLRAPSARSGGAGAFLPTLGAAVMFGGTAGDGVRAFLGDTWLWAGAWTSVDAVMPPGGNKPSPRAGHAFAAGAVSSGSDYALLVGGQGEGGLLGDVWLLRNHLGWSKWSSTTPRVQAALAQVANTGYILFGGLGASGLVEGTGLWSISTGNWTNFIGSGQSPPLRYGHAMATDVVANKVVLFGGRNATSVFGDTWVLNLATPTSGWQQVTTPAAPRPRFGHAMSFDSVRNRVLLTGGETSNPAAALGDTWEWDFATNAWRAIPVAEYDGRAGETAWFDPAREQLVVFGGLAHHDEGKFAFTFDETLRLGNLGRSASPGWAENGLGCSSDGDCGSGFCVDGYCCNTRCNSQCGACDVPGFEGSCVASRGQPHGSRPACADEHSLCASQCDGSDTEACHLTPAGTECGSEPLDTCFGNSLLTARSKCDGAGSCTPATGHACAPYLCCSDCEPDMCFTSCYADNYCLPGHVCISNQCVVSP